MKLEGFVKERRNKFFTLEYQNTTKINEANQKSLYYPMHNDDSVNSGIMEDLYMISELIKN